MAGMVILSVALRFLQEARADSAAAKLKATIHVTATVIRDGQARELPLRERAVCVILFQSTLDIVAG